MLPFDVLERRGLDPKDLSIIDNVGKDYVFKCGDKYFLHASDRSFENNSMTTVELPHGGPSTTVAHAWETLKPPEVVAAESGGNRMVRQGRWFFIPTLPPKERVLSERDKLLCMIADGSYYGSNTWADAAGGEKFYAAIKNESEKLTEELRRDIKIGGTHVQTGLVQDGKNYVLGKISKGGYKEIVLDAWHIAVPDLRVRQS